MVAIRWIAQKIASLFMSSETLQREVRTDSAEPNRKEHDSRFHADFFLEPYNLSEK